MTIGELIVRIAGDTTDLDRDMDRTTSNLDKFGNNLSRITNYIKGVFAMYTGKKLFDFTIANNADFEQYQQSFEVVLKSADAAQKKLAYLSKFAADTPFETAPLVQASILLENANLQTEKYLTTIGDTTAAFEKFGATVPEVTQPLAKLASGQTGEALERLRDFGITTRDLMEKGIKFDKGGSVLSSISATMDAVIAVMDEKYGGMMKKQSTTFNGIMSTIKDNISAFGRDVGEDLFDKLKEKQSDFMDAWDKWSKDGTLNKAADDISDVLLTVFNGLTKAVEIMYEYGKEITAIIGAVVSLSTALRIASTVQTAFNISAAANPYIAIAAGIATLVGGIATYIAVSKEAERQTVETLKATKQELNETDNLIQEHNELSSKINKTTEEKNRLHEIEVKLAELYPDVANGIDTENQRYVTQIGLVQKLRDEKQKDYEQDLKLTVQSGVEQKNKWMSKREQYKAEYEKYKADIEKTLNVDSLIDKFKAASGKGAADHSYYNTKEFQSIVSAVQNWDNGIRSFAKSDPSEIVNYVSSGKARKDREKLAQMRDQALKNYNEYKDKVDTWAQASVELDNLNNYHPGNTDYQNYINARYGSESTGKTYKPLDTSSRGSGSSNNKNEAFDNAVKLLDHKKKINQISLEDEIKTLQSIKSLYAKSAAETMEIDERVYEAQKAIIDKKFQNSLNWINEQKELGKLSAQDEIAAWERVYKNQKNNIEAVKQASQNLYRLKKELADKEQQETKDRLEKMVTEYIDSKRKQIEADYEEVESKEKLAEREKTLSDLRADEEKYRYAATEEGQKTLQKIRDDIAKIEKDAAKEKRDQEKKDKLAALDDEQKQMLSAVEKFSKDSLSTLKDADAKLKDALLSATKTYNQNQDSLISEGLNKLRRFVTEYKRIASEISSPAASGTNTGTATKTGDINVNLHDYGDKILSGIDDIQDFATETMHAVFNFVSAAGGKK